METPNIDSWDAAVQQDLLGRIPHSAALEHVLAHHTSSARLLTDAGLEVIDTRYQTGHSFWMYSSALPDAVSGRLAAEVELHVRSVSSKGPHCPGRWVFTALDKGAL